MQYLSLFLFSLGLLFSSLGHAKIAISLVHKKGPVAVVSGGKKIKAKKGMPLSVKDEIRTGKNSLAIIHIDTVNARQTLKLDKGSILRLESVTKSQQVSRLKRGGVFLYLKSKLKGKSANPKVILRAKSIAMGVRGTEFFASFGPKGHREDFWMCVNEGKVKVTSKESKKGVTVNEGEGIQITAGKEIEKPKPYEWTKKLNWNADPKKGKTENEVELDGIYNDLLDQDYD